jgi:hypothetical protein
MISQRALFVLLAFSIMISACNEDPVNLRGQVAGPKICQPIELEYYLESTDDAAKSDSGVTSVKPDGTFTIENISTGTYDIFLKPEGYLQMKFAGRAILEDDTKIEFGTFSPGDLNNDNYINAEDFAILTECFGSDSSSQTYNPAADMDCNGIIDKIDFTTFSKSFGMMGDELRSSKL